MAHKRKARSSSFGSVRKLASGRWQARYCGPDSGRYTGPDTFDTKGDAETYLATVRADIARGAWVSPAEAKARAEAEAAARLTFGEFAEAWLERRTLKPRTRAHYRRLLDRFLLPTFGGLELAAINPAAVDKWHAGLHTGPTYRAHAYSLLRSIMAEAVDRDHVVKNPCRIRGASKSTGSGRDVEPATVEELAALTEAMPERLRLLVQLSAWCALRFGEVSALRRRDVDTKRGVVHVRRGAVRVGGEVVVDSPKTAAGRRSVHMPPHVVGLVEKHLREHAQITPDGLLFYAVKSGEPLAHSSLLWHFNRAKVVAERPDLTPHALRHTGAVLAAQSGATVRELMARLGHTTPTMAMHYQHAAAERDAAIAERLSALAAGS